MGLPEAPKADVAMFSSTFKQQGVPASADELDYTPYTGYRLLYHFDKFVSGWRQLLVFYLTMYIAGYAQIVSNLVFWGAWATLLLVYWEPYLSPPLPWTNDYSGPEDSFHDIQHPVPAWGRKLLWLMPVATPTPQEAQAMRMWLHAVRRSLPQRQLSVHCALQVSVALPCACLGVGIIGQHKQQHMDDKQAIYSSYLLFAVVLLYTILTWMSYALHYQLHRKLTCTSNGCWASQPGCQDPGQAPSMDSCKADSEAGSCSRAYSFGCQDQTQPGHQASFQPTWQADKASTDTPAWQPKHMLYFVCKILGETLNVTVQTLVAGSFVKYMTNDIFWMCIAITGMSYTATNLLFEMGPGEPVSEDGEGYTACWCLPSALRGKQQQPQGSDDNPPFLLYKWPKGLRGWSIIALLIAVAGPSVAIVVRICIAISNNTPEKYYVASSDCQDDCFKRYQVMLLILGSLGVLSSYYAFTVGFLGCGPVTWLYRTVHHCMCYRMRPAQATRVNG